MRTAANSQTRVYLIISLILVGLIFFRVWTTSQDQDDNNIPPPPPQLVLNNDGNSKRDPEMQLRAIEEEEEELRNLEDDRDNAIAEAEAEALAQENQEIAMALQNEEEDREILHGAEDQEIKVVETKVEDPNEKFSVNDRGYWEGLGATKGHLFDEPLAKGLLEFWKKENVGSILELGAGTGTYAKLFMENGLFVSCYDGNPSTQELSEGRCGVIDLSKPLDFVQHDWVMSLEVGEHIPAEFESIFIQNLHKLNKKGLILSWAIVGQGGTAHVNNKNNDEVKAKFYELGYTTDEEVEKDLRNKAYWGWFKNTVMVFRKNV